MRKEFSFVPAIPFRKLDALKNQRCWTMEVILLSILTQNAEIIKRYIISELKF